MNPQIDSGSHPLLVILGPTGSGKSDLGLALAEEFGGEIVNSDSVQVHQGLDIGSAKTPPDKRRGIPHHLLDVVRLDDELTAGAYARLARQALSDVRSRGKLPIVVGGTGFYVRALLEGLSPAPERDPKLRYRLGEVESRRPGTLYRFIRRHDPTTAARIHPNDVQKLTRTVEMTLTSGWSASEIQRVPRAGLTGFSVLKIGLAPRREDLRRHINERTERMFASGLLGETRALLDAGWPSNGKALQSLGYRQAIKVLSGEMSVAEAIVECQEKTCQYAKRQMTWFRRDADIHWLSNVGLSGFGTDLSLKREAVEIAGRWLLSDFGYWLSKSEQR